MIIKNLKESREIMNLKQKDLAKFFHVNYSTYSGWETGKDTIKLSNLIKYANRFNFSLDYLYGFQETNNFTKKFTLNKSIIGTNLKKLRLKYNYTQQQIAKNLNCSRSTYSGYETGRYLISTQFLFALNKIYSNFSADIIVMNFNTKK